MCGARGRARGRSCVWHVEKSVSENDFLGITLYIRFGDPIHVMARAAEVQLLSTHSVAGRQSLEARSLAGGAHRPPLALHPHALPRAPASPWA
eukprot:6881791-Prymnesium_polylepis.1